jgi:hypothetical protein
VDAETYIEQYGAGLTEAEKRYIRAFGAPEFTPGPARNPYTPGVRIANALPEQAALDEERQADEGV